VVAARAAITLVRERVDSPRETWLRLCLVLAGLPTPEWNLIIGDDQGPIGRVDLVYLTYKLISNTRAISTAPIAISGMPISTAMKTSLATSGR